MEITIPIPCPKMVEPGWLGCQMLKMLWTWKKSPTNLFFRWLAQFPGNLRCWQPEEMIVPGDKSTWSWKYITLFQRLAHFQQMKFIAPGPPSILVFIYIWIYWFIYVFIYYMFFIYANIVPTLLLAFPSQMFRSQSTWYQRLAGGQLGSTAVMSFCVVTPSWQQDDSWGTCWEAFSLDPKIKSIFSDIDPHLQS